MAKILIVDDEPRIRELIREHLQHAGYECDEATDGSAALAKLTVGGIWNIYELLPAFLVNVAVLVAVSLLTAQPNEQIEQEFADVQAAVKQ